MSYKSVFTPEMSIANSEFLQTASFRLVSRLMAEAYGIHVHANLAF